MTSATAPVNIGGVMVGDVYPTVLVAEIGTFFNKDIELATSYLKAAVEAGAPIFAENVYPFGVNLLVVARKPASCSGSAV